MSRGFVCVCYQCRRSLRCGCQRLLCGTINYFACAMRRRSRGPPTVHEPRRHMAGDARETITKLCATGEDRLASTRGRWRLLQASVNTACRACAVSPAARMLRKTLTYTHEHRRTGYTGWQFKVVCTRQYTHHTTALTGSNVPETTDISSAPSRHVPRPCELKYFYLAGSVVSTIVVSFRIGVNVLIRLVCQTP